MAFQDGRRSGRAVHVGIVLALLVMAAPSQAASVSERRIEVDGIAQLDVVPDRVDIVLRLEETAKTPAQAAEALAKKRATVRAGLASAGVGVDDVVVSHLDLQPAHRARDERVKSYTARLTLVATTTPERLAPVADAAVLAGADGISTRFRASKLPERKRELRELALSAARDKAQQMAKAMGVRVGAVQAIRESGGGGSAWPWSAGLANVAAVAPGPSGGDETPGDLRPDTITLSLTVQVVFAIE